MKFLLCILFITTAAIQAQVNRQVDELHTERSIRLFAAHLFCEHDFLRAALEYDRLLSSGYADTAAFFAAISYQHNGSYQKAAERLGSIEMTSSFYTNAKTEYLKTLFIAGSYNQLLSEEVNYESENDTIITAYNRLAFFSQLLSDGDTKELSQPPAALFANETASLDSVVTPYYDPGYRSPTVAALLSAVIPGSGKIYTGYFGDGITSLLVTGLLGFLSYDNFQQENTFRGWLFGGLTAFFYAGNIYGSAVSAKLHNTEFDYRREQNLLNYIKNRKYYMPGGEVTPCD